MGIVLKLCILFLFRSSHLRKLKTRIQPQPYESSAHITPVARCNNILAFVPMLVVVLVVDIATLCWSVATLYRGYLGSGITHHPIG
jgi:hypothetical protein